MDVGDYKDMQLYTTISLGSEQEPFDMIFDTGSNWLFVYSRICLNCPYFMKQFDERESSTFLFKEPIIDLHYGSADVYGYPSMDSVCLGPD